MKLYKVMINPQRGSYMSDSDEGCMFIKAETDKKAIIKAMKGTIMDILTVEVEYICLVKDIIR